MLVVAAVLLLGTAALDPGSLPVADASPIPPDGADVGSPGVGLPGGWLGPQDPLVGLLPAPASDDSVAPSDADGLEADEAAGLPGAEAADGPDDQPMRLPERDAPPGDPFVPETPATGLVFGLPCLHVMGDLVSASACPGKVLPGRAASPSAATAGKAAQKPVIAGSEPWRAGNDRMLFFPLTGASHAEGVPEAASVDPHVERRAAAPDDSHPGGANDKAWLGAAAAAAAIAPTLALLLKLLASLAVRRRRHASPRREALLALIAQDPGIHHTELVRRSGFGNGAVQHHLRRMVEAGEVVRVRTAGHSCFFPGTGLDPALATVRTAVRAPVSRQLLALLAQRPRTLSALARDAGLPVTTVHYHIAKLVRAGALAPDPSVGRRALGLTPLGRRALAPGLEPTAPTA